MQRLLDRLDRKLKWTLIAPQAQRPIRTVDHARAHSVLVQRVLQLRAAMGRLPDQPELRHCFSAAGVWHLISTDAVGDIAGTVRLYVIDRHYEPLQPADIAHISHVQFPCAQVQGQHLLALQRLFDQKAEERFFIAAGGMFTTPAWLRSGAAASCCGTATALQRRGAASSPTPARWPSARRGAGSQWATARFASSTRRRCSGRAD